MPNQEEDDEVPSLATELAWEFCQKKRSRQNPSRDEYLNRLPDQESRDEFNLLTGMDEFTELAVDHEADSELKQALSELPKDGPDIIHGEG